MARTEIIGMKELEKAIENLGKLPQKCVSKAARQGASIALKAARAKSPFLTGDLRKGVVMKGERRTIPGKKVYDVMMDPAKNDIFVKTSKDGNRSYYPASMEYGFITASGRYIPGDHYLRDSITNHAPAIEQKMVDVLAAEIDKELGKG